MPCYGLSSFPQIMEKIPLHYHHQEELNSFLFNQLGNLKGYNNNTSVLLIIFRATHVTFDESDVSKSFIKLYIKSLNAHFLIDPQHCQQNHGCLRSVRAQSTLDTSLQCIMGPVSAFQQLINCLGQIMHSRTN